MIIDDGRLLSDISDHNLIQVECEIGGKRKPNTQKISILDSRKAASLAQKGLWTKMSKGSIKYEDLKSEIESASR